MRELKRLLVVSERYPTPGDPVFTFVDELLVQLDALGVEIQVVSPRSETRTVVRGAARQAHVWRRETPRGGFWVRQPAYLTLGHMLPWLGRRLYRRAVAREIRGMDFAPDACYAHFWRSALAAARALPKGPKVFVGCGESALKTVFAGEAKAMLPRIGGVVSVSGKNKADCQALYGVPEDMIQVLPNGVDGGTFHPLSPQQRQAQRQRLGIGPEELAVIFVGWFNQRKGVKRVEAALQGLEGVKALYIGSGDMTPEGDNIAFCGRVEHDQMPLYLGAADVFVLPTLAEGCCNAIVEAMACGLPVISSQGSFNDGLLHPQDSIRVDPQDVEAIRRAVTALRDDPARRLEMGRQALGFAQGLDVNQRARKIKAFIESRL